RAERERLAADEAKARQGVEKRLAAAKRSFDRIVDAIADGSVTTATVRDKLAILQAEMDRHQADLAANTSTAECCRPASGGSSALHLPSRKIGNRPSR
ncbi:hypothetical protein JDN40_00090, partial [Rhodomicrobium vannielii ATCC 17100]|uniref:hypothetical protein n=1 Tax=Rhodomicrobium vannielii TaxID=1069 RepID=UPI001A2AC66D|nr:hypothetical protein [Rhodomicrobium vannielii ATCC 17100]